MSSSIHLFSVAPQSIKELPLDPSVHQVHEVMDRFESGVYTALRSFGGKRFLGLAEHLDRLEGSMSQMGFALPVDREALMRALDELVERFGEQGEDSVFRIDVLPEDVVYPGAHGRLLITRGTLSKVPQEFLERGVEIAITEKLRRKTPSIKTADFVLARRPYPLGTRSAYEHLMVDDEGYLLEATSSNFYGVLGGELRTASAGVLAGITRRFLLFLCAGLELPVNTSPIHRSQLGSLDEAFLTSSTRGIVPVVKVDGISIGDGHPGATTKALLKSYAVLCERSARRAGSTPAKN